MPKSANGSLVHHDGGRPALIICLPAGYTRRSCMFSCNHPSSGLAPVGNPRREMIRSISVAVYLRILYSYSGSQYICSTEVGPSFYPAFVSVDRLTRPGRPHPPIPSLSASTQLAGKG